ncbi:MAG: hypothetical protein ACRCYY_09470 [Trueperaceae bacterium]
MYKIIFYKIIPLLLLTFCLVSCDVTGAQGYNFIGMWTGVFKDSVSGEGTMTVNIVYQSSGSYQEAQLGGDWQVDFGANGQAAGIFQGTTYDFEGLGISFYPQDAPLCSFRPTTVRNDDHLGATYIAVSSQPCLEAGFGQGTFSVTKQF